MFSIIDKLISLKDWITDIFFKKEINNENGNKQINKNGDNYQYNYYGSNINDIEKESIKNKIYLFIKTYPYEFKRRPTTKEIAENFDMEIYEVKKILIEMKDDRIKMADVQIDAWSNDCIWKII